MTLKVEQKQTEEIMTPMQSLKNQFDSFKKILPETFKELSLNKSEDECYIDNFCGEQTIINMKGVRSDFIKTFKIKFNDENSYSIGFSFSYLNIPENEQKIQVSIKVGNKDPLFKVSDFLNINEFKEKFKETIKNLELLEDKNHLNIIKIIEDDFNLKINKHKRKKKIK